MQKNDLKNEEISFFVLRKKNWESEGSGKGKNQLGKVGEEREEAEKNPSKRTAGNCSRGKGVTFQGPADKRRESWSKNGDRPWELIMYALKPAPSQYGC